MKDSWIRKDKNNTKRIILFMIIAVIITILLYTLKKYNIQIVKPSKGELIIHTNTNSGNLIINISPFKGSRIEYSEKVNKQK